MIQQTYLSFPIMCDGFTELSPITIHRHDYNYTDEN